MRITHVSERAPINDGCAQSLFTVFAEPTCVTLDTPATAQRASFDSAQFQTMSVWSGSISLATSASVVQPSDAATLTATTSVTVDGSGYYILIFNETTGSLATLCSSGTTCSVDVYRNESGFDEYTAYIGDYTTSLPVPNEQASSDTVSVAMSPFTVSIATNLTTVIPGQAATLTATINQSISTTNYYILIFNETTGSLITNCSSGTTCSANVYRNESGFDEYTAYVGDYTTSLPVPNEQASSDTVSVAMRPYTVSIATNHATVTTGQAATLTATINQTIDPTNYYILIFNETTGNLVTNCSSGTTCIVDVYRNRNGSDNYKAYVGEYSSTLPVTNEQAASAAVNVALVPFEVTLTTDRTSITTDQSAMLTASTNETVDGTDFYILIFNQSTGQIAGSCSYGLVCQIDVHRYENGSDVYVAYVAPYASTISTITDSQAVSGTVTVSLVPFQVSLHSTASVITTEQYSTLTATVNQPIDSTQFYIMIYNETTDSVAGYCYSGDICQLQVNQYTAGTSVYRAYIAPYTSAPPTVYQARSNTVSVTLQRFLLRLTANATDTNPPDVEIKTYTNQNVDNTPYWILIFDAGQSNNLIAYCYSGKTCSTITTADPEQSHRYIAFIAPYDYTAPPAGYVAISNQGGDPLSGGPTGTYETAGGTNPSQNCTQCSAGDPINTATGEFYLNQTDLDVPGRGNALRFTRSYTVSRSDTDGPLGYGWTNNYAMRLEPDPPSSSLASADRIAVVQENGSQVVFTLNSSGDYDAPSRTFATLTRNATSGVFTFTRRSRDTFTFDAAGALTTLSDLNGYETTLSYDSSDRLASVTDPAGRALTFTYNPDDKIATVTDPASRVESYTYNTAGDLTKATNPAGKDLQFAYTSQHWMTTQTDERGKVTTNTFDGFGRVIVQTDPLNRQTAFSYATDGTTTVTDPAGNITEHAYTDGMLMRTTTAVGTADETIVSTTYDPLTLGVASRTDANNHVWTYQYDSQGNRTHAEDPLTNETSWTYNSYGQVLTSTNALGITTTNTYDTSGNLLTTSTPSSATGPAVTTTLTYGDTFHPSDVTAITDPEGKTSTYTYTTAGYPASATDPESHAATFSYNSIGWMTSSVSPRGNETGATPADYTTTMTYDAMGRQLSVTDPLGRTQTTTYDASGNPLTQTGSNNETTEYLYDAAAQLTKTTLPDATQQLRTYTPTGQLATQTDGKGKTTTYAYDDADRITSMTDPLSRATSYTYDAAGRTSQITDPASRTVTLGYDAADRVASVDYSDTAMTDLAFTYDAAGQRTTMNDETTTTTTTYDDLGRITQTINGASDTVGYNYDLNGQLTSLTYPGTSRTVTYAYDDAGRMTDATDWLSQHTSFDYDADANQTATTYPNGVTTTNTYNRAGEPTNITHTTTTATLASFAYTYAASSGQLTQTASTGTPSAGTETYTYTALEQLHQVTGGTLPGSYSFDDAQNLTTHANGDTLAYDDARQLTTLTPASGPATSYTYNALGERTDQTTGTSSIGYAYDQASHLTAYTPTTGPSTSYTYNADNLRQSITTGTTTQHMTWTQASGLPLLLDDDQHAYIYGAGGTPISQIDPANTTEYLHQDALGSTRLITNATGAAIGTATYTAYGQPTITGTVSRLGYAGQYTDPQSGLQYLRARYYDPQTGQFLTRDPIEDVTGDPYGYAGGNPVMNTDPSGLDWRTTVSTASAGAGDWLSGGFMGHSASSWARDQLGSNCMVDKDSFTYHASEGVGQALGIAAGGEAVGLVRLRMAYEAEASAVAGASASGRDAVAARNALKEAYRGDTPSILNRIAERRNLARYGNRVGPSYEQLLEEYGSDEAVKAAAGRTSSGIGIFR